MLIQSFSMSVLGMGEEYQRLACTAPCSMYSVLLEHGLLADPFVGLNELQTTGLSEQDCRFEAKFMLDKKALHFLHQRLLFEGLDTLCDIRLNGKLLSHTENMHRSYAFEVSTLLVEGENTLTLDFASPTRYFKTWNDKHFLWTNGDTIPGAAHLRKALYMSGWDWGPKLPDMGIFRQISLTGYDVDRIAEVEILQHHKPNQVALEVSLSTQHQSGCDAYLQIDGQRVKLVDGKGAVVIDNPKLWWVRGYGDQPLYEAVFTLEKDGVVLDRQVRRIGLRTLTVSTQKDAVGNEFCFVNNGVKIFAMGANYVPQDNLISRISSDSIRKLLDACADANYNCIRVWGGGYYPSEEFYDLCDAYGFVVWQDFMIACANVWLRKRFQEEFLAEAEENIKRLRHHASLGLLCGNNEMETAVMHWEGVCENATVKMDYLKLYEHLLPDLCEEYAPQTFYWPSSPSNGGGFENPNDEKKGDVHYWSVWHGGIPFTDYRKHTFRFCSEYGFESFPSVKTIRSFADLDEMNPFSRVMENHQKCQGGNRKILTYLADTYLYPRTFENVVYASQLLQAKAIGCGVEHFRRQRGICMGSIYWQCNDCWPVASWSSIDYYGRYKALHYAAKKFYAPIAMGLFWEDGVLTVNVSNETRKPFAGKLRVSLRTNENQVLEQVETEVGVDALTASDVQRYLPKKADAYCQYMAAELLDDHGSLLSRKTVLFCEPKHFAFLNPNITVTYVGKSADGVQIALQSKSFAQDVWLDFAAFDAVFSENCIDLIDDKPYYITVHGVDDKSEQEILSALQCKSVYNIGADC